MTVAEIAARANEQYGWDYPARVFVVARKWDHLGRRMVFAGSKYVGALDERRGLLILNRREG